MGLLTGFAGISTNVAGQEAGDPGVLEFDGKLVQLSVEGGEVFVAGLGEAPEADPRLEGLAGRVENHLSRTEALEERQLSDMESLYRGTNYARKLLAKIDLLIKRIEFLGGQAELNGSVKAAAAAFDVPLIKQLLKGKLALEDENVAEAAFQLAGFQELDGEYQDAWGNYQKASNLEPGNQLYMDAHGKNEF